MQSQSVYWYQRREVRRETEKIMQETKDILIGWRFGTKNLTYCDNDSTRSIMRDLAIEIETALAKGEPIYTIHLEYGEPV